MPDFFFRISPGAFSYYQSAPEITVWAITQLRCEDTIAHPEAHTRGPFSIKENGPFHESNELILKPIQLEKSHNQPSPTADKMSALPRPGKPQFTDLKSLHPCLLYSKYRRHACQHRATIVYANGHRAWTRTSSRRDHVNDRVHFILAWVKCRPVVRYDRFHSAS